MASWLVNKMSGLIMGAEDDAKEDAPANAAAPAPETAYTQHARTNRTKRTPIPDF